ncbi:superoxide dismutase, Fe-Mn family [Marininema mesophilum]|uniref:superoxide dismutase n=1 Tax=Marininema mesophilum TaxID=1048340 RepID=A0A1H2UEI4_9BACL|nr:superoxide dismutase [Marininema mesophilum]SDW54530.1 superoxide dismutase, Fe-Mn family [Marininema mesophilum]
MSSLGSNADRLRKDIQRFAQQGQHLIHHSLNQVKNTDYSLFKATSEQGYYLIDQLKEMEEESRTVSWDALKQLAQQTWKIRTQTESWLQSFPPNSIVNKASQPENNEEADGHKRNQASAIQDDESHQMDSSYAYLSPVPPGQHQLPPLPYPYDALEPYIDTVTMHIHHDQLHLNYVKNLNKAELMLQQSRETGNFDLIQYWEGELAFNGAGHYLHTLFWETMSPHGGGKPSGSLSQAISYYFGSFDAFKKQFSSAAEKVQGGGWAILVWAPRAHRLEILQAEKHQNLSQWDNIPLLSLDVWEHAYYLKYPNQRKLYIESWWNIVNWPEVESRFEVASQVAWQPY